MSIASQTLTSKHQCVANNPPLSASNSLRKSSHAVPRSSRSRDATQSARSNGRTADRRHNDRHIRQTNASGAGRAIPRHRPPIRCCGLPHCRSPTILLRAPGTLSPHAHALYITGTTIIASIVTAFTMGQIKTVWLREILREQNGDAMRDFQRARRARTILGIGSVVDTFNFSQITTSVIIIGLITASIVSSVTPGITQVPRSFLNKINPGLAPDSGGCWNTQSGPADFAWHLPNGSYLVQDDAQQKQCPATIALKLVDQTYVPPGYKYQGTGVPVTKNALGTPFSAPTSMVTHLPSELCQQSFLNGEHVTLFRQQRVCPMLSRIL